MAKRGQPGYGKMTQLKEQVDKFSPLFWQIMEEMARSKSKDDKRFFVQEFNKIQSKMIPTEIGGINGEPIQITWKPSQFLTVHADGLTSSTTQLSDG